MPWGWWHAQDQQERRQPEPGGTDTFWVGGSSVTLFAGDGDDVVHAVGAERNRIHCGLGFDTVEADALDRVAADCEAVTRS